MKTTWLIRCCLLFVVAVSALGGCAELAGATPSLRLEASATRRRFAEETGSGEQWSWGFGVGLGGAFGAPPPLVRAPRPREVATLATAPCRVLEACEWEARARARALERARVWLGAEARR